MDTFCTFSWKSVKTVIFVIFRVIGSEGSKNLGDTERFRISENGKNSGVHCGVELWCQWWWFLTILGYLDPWLYPKEAWRTALGHWDTAVVYVLGHVGWVAVPGVVGVRGGAYPGGSPWYGSGPSPTTVSPLFPHCGHCFDQFWHFRPISALFGPILA